MRIVDVVPEPDPYWREDAECRGVIGDRTGATEPHPFYPHSGRQGPEAPHWAYCNICPVRVACTAEAMVGPERHGIWGGMNERELERLRRRLQRGTLTWSVVASGALWEGWTPEEASASGE